MMGKAIRDAYGEALVRYGANDPRVVVLDADVSSSTKSALFGKAFPERFFNCGISEYAMTGMAAGLAAAGKIPFVNTFAAFLTTIGFLPAKSLLSYSGLNVKYMGAYGGLSDSYDGPTHHATEDVALMRTLPGMVVMAPCDETQTDWMVRCAIEHEGPMYIRLSRNACPVCYKPGESFALGKGKVLREGADVTILSYGVLLHEALAAAALLANEGVGARVVDLFAIKPLDRALVLACAADTGALVVAEEHNVIGGLGSAVAQELALAGCPAALSLVGLPDTFAETGDYAGLFHRYGLDAPAIAQAAKAALARK